MMRKKKEKESTAGLESVTFHSIQPATYLLPQGRIARTIILSIANLDVDDLIVAALAHVCSLRHIKKGLQKC